MSYQDPSKVEYYSPPRAEKSIRAHVLDSDFVHALVYVLCALIVVPLLMWSVGGDTQTAIRLTVWIALLPFGFILVGRALRIFSHTLVHAAAVGQAVLELIAQRDLNNSHSIGDVKRIAAPPTILYDELDPNIETPKQMRAVFLRHHEEFIKRGEIVGYARSEWVKEGKGTQNYKFVCDGEECGREEYEAHIKLRELRGRGQGKTGKPIAPPRTPDMSV